MKKTIITLILFAGITLSLLAQQYDPESDFKVSIQDNGKSVVITKYVGSKQMVKIPPIIQGLPVIGIGNGAFLHKIFFSVTIPNGVTSIGKEAFAFCNALASVTIGNSVTSIGEGAFHDCVNLASITIPNSVTSIGEMAFAGTSLTSVNIPNSITSIEKNAFINCTSLTSVTIPNSVTSIGVRAFQECTSLASITIPNSVTDIGNQAFYQCTSLANVTFQGTITSANFGSDSYPPFLGDLRDKYLAGGIGTYTRASGGRKWTKQ
jgi:hypothetical protein